MTYKPGELEEMTARILALKDNVNLRFGKGIQVAKGVTIGDLFDAFVEQAARNRNPAACERAALLWLKEKMGPELDYKQAGSIIAKALLGVPPPDRTCEDCREVLAGADIAYPVCSACQARRARKSLTEWLKMNDIPRRICVDLMTPQELAIRSAILSIEEGGCDVRLTEAVNLLQQAREKVADFVDDVAPVPPQAALPACSECGSTRVVHSRTCSYWTAGDERVEAVLRPPDLKARLERLRDEAAKAQEQADAEGKESQVNLQLGKYRAFVTALRLLEQEGTGAGLA